MPAADQAVYTLEQAEEDLSVLRGQVNLLSEILSQVFQLAGGPSAGAPAAGYQQYMDGPGYPQIISANDGNSYDMCTQTLVASGQNVNSLSLVPITGVGSISLGLGTYYISGQIIALPAGAAGAISLEWVAGGGLTASTFAMALRETQAGGPAVEGNAGYVTALGGSSLFNGATFTNVATRHMVFQGIIVVSHAGTLTPEVATITAAADSWTLEAATVVQVVPVVAV